MNKEMERLESENARLQALLLAAASTEQKPIQTEHVKLAEVKVKSEPVSISENPCEEKSRENENVDGVVVVVNENEVKVVEEQEQEEVVEEQEEEEQEEQVVEKEEVVKEQEEMLDC